MCIRDRHKAMQTEQVMQVCRYVGSTYVRTFSFDSMCSMYICMYGWIVDLAELIFVIVPQRSFNVVP